MFFKEQFDEMQKIANQIFNNPELGYKEWKTKQLVEEFLKSKNNQIELDYFSTTGIKTYLSKDKPITMAFIAELDAVYAPTHFCADKETGAAHNCGHFTQITTALSLYAYFIETAAYKNYDFNIAFVFIPAEEYLDLDYRETLRQEGTITYYGGKPEAMKLGVFDDIDFGVCVHSIGETFDEPTIEIGCDLAGFLYKRYHFEGKATHAGFDPFSGVNAYSMSTMFNVALGLLRQQVRDDQLVRFNPILMNSNMSTNVIPNRVTVGTDLRTKSIEYMQETAKKLDLAAEHSAAALSGNVKTETQMGYLPFVQDTYLNSFVKHAFDKNEEITGLIDDRGGIAAAGDIGDLAFMFPCIQISYGGFTGAIHGDDFRMIDDRFVLEQFPRFVSQVFEEMNGQLDTTKLYKRSYNEYEKLIQSITD
ncbi:MULTISPECIES: M20/M25/M40 family metallo-hydrolase [unclassified Listeria]|uniref:M20/M25/M40 family metallo-hydrolase n=1 Tax=unclassified Listeria TaxID=2642072 RepID=UPI000B593C59|nr:MULTISPECIES: M20/M25/M40 family metallo-hydrolase [unclassified Listeria]